MRSEGRVAASGWDKKSDLGGHISASRASGMFIDSLLGTIPNDNVGNGDNVYNQEESGGKYGDDDDA